MANPFKDRWDKLDPDEIRSAQGALLQRYLRDCVVSFSPHYKSVFDEAGLDPDSIKSLEKLRQIPFPTKQDLQPTPDNPMRARDFVVVPDRRRITNRRLLNPAITIKLPRVVATAAIPASEEDHYTALRVVGHGVAVPRTGQFPG